MKRFATSAAMILSFAATSAFAQKDESLTYKVDPTHASIIFKVSHMDYSNVYGMFPNAEGQIVWNDAKPEKSSIEVTIPVADVNTGVKKRDDHLRGPDFFNAKQFPKITLKSKSIKKAGDKKYDVTAALTMNGVTKDVNFTFTHMKTAKDPWGLNRTGGETAFKVKRSDFGMKYMSKPGEIGDEIELVVSLEGTRS